MSSTRARPKPAPARAVAAAPAADVNSEVLTLAEAAAYLRVSPEDMRSLVCRPGFPGRPIGEEWRFLKSALEDWLRTPPARPSQESFLALAGAWKDDPDLPEIVRAAYRRRGRPITEDGE